MQNRDEDWLQVRQRLKAALLQADVMQGLLYPPELNPSRTQLI